MVVFAKVSAVFLPAKQMDENRYVMKNLSAKNGKLIMKILDNVRRKVPGVNCLLANRDF